MTFILKALLFLLLLPFSSIFAGEKGGNGGFSVTVDGTSYLLDLYEASLHLPRIHLSHSDELQIAETALLYVPNLDMPTALYLANRMNGLALKSPGLAKKLKSIMLSYDWRISPKKFIPVDDIGATPYDRNELQLSKVAFRDNSMLVVWLSQEDWAALDPRSRSALILHELIYAFSVEARASMTSEYVRLAVSFVYSDGMDTISIDAFNQKMQRYIGAFQVVEGTTGMSCEDIHLKAEEIFARLDVLFSTSIVSNGPILNRRSRKICSGTNDSSTQTIAELFACFGIAAYNQARWHGVANLYFYGDAILPYKNQILNAAYPHRDGTIESELRSLYHSAHSVFKEDLTGKCFPQEASLRHLTNFLLSTADR